MKPSHDLRILTGDDVRAVLTGRERETLSVVEAAYRMHSRGETTCPHSVFLPLPGKGSRRVIALPAYLGGPMDVAGMKWISSFPGNIERGQARASAVMVLNSMQTGRAFALLEGAMISAMRTAASAALAASRLVESPPRITRAGIIGCGLINQEVVKFLQKVFPNLSAVTAYDCKPEQVQNLVTACEDLGIAAEPAPSSTAVLQSAPLVSIATSAVEPHISTLEGCSKSAVILHLSLRDLAPQAILAANNVVDDPEHVCRANTSIDLAARAAGNRTFVQATIGAILNGQSWKRDARPVVFSPFGLGILDVALAAYVYASAQSADMGTIIRNFHGSANPAREMRHALAAESCFSGL